MSNNKFWLNTFMAIAVVVVRYLTSKIFYVVRFVKKHYRVIIDLFVIVIMSPKRRIIEQKLLEVAERTRIELNSKVFQYERVNLLPALLLEFKWRGPIEVIPLNSEGVLIKVPRMKELNEIILTVTEKYATRFMTYLRHHIDQRVKRSLEYLITRKMILKLDTELYHDSHLLRNLFNDKYSTYALLEQELLPYVYKLENITKKGLLEILLTAYWEFGERIQKDIPRVYMLNESLGIFNFLASMAAKDPEEEVDLKFKGKVISLGFVLVKAKRVAFFERYSRCIQRFADNDVEMLFILGAGIYNSQMAILVANDFIQKNNSQWKMLAPMENEMSSAKGRKIKCLRILVTKKEVHRKV